MGMEEEEMQCLCKKLAKEGTAGVQDMDTIAQVDKQSLNKASYSSELARQTLADERKRHRDSAIQSILSLKNILQGLQADPEDVEEEAVGMSEEDVQGIQKKEPPQMGQTAYTAMSSCASIKENNPQVQSGVYWLHLD